MLKVRLIPTLLWKDYGLVKGVAFDSWRRVGTVQPAIRVHNARDVDELAIFDITASASGSAPDFESVSDFADDCFVPLTFGGGVSSLTDFQVLLRAGADKVSLNTAAYSQPTLVDEAARRFGSQCVVASIDARRIEGEGHSCFSHAGTQDTKRRPSTWARELEARGAGEVIITSIDRDGTMTGYDLELIEEVSTSVRIPVIASGGAGSFDDMVKAVRDAGASAVAAASIFHFTQRTPAEAKRFLAENGVPVRESLPQATGL